jgi:hypothetical protein
VTSEEHYLIGHIQDVLAADPRTCKQDITIYIRDRHLWLVGQTSTEERRQIIEAVVSELAPELGVRNEIKVIEVLPPVQAEIITP